MFVISLVVIVIALMVSSNFIWNIEVRQEDGSNIENIEQDIKEAGLKIKYNEDAKELNKKETVIASQIPSAGINVNAESTVFVTLE